MSETVKKTRPRGDLKYVKDELYDEYKEAFIKGRRAYKYIIKKHKNKKNVNNVEKEPDTKPNRDNLNKFNEMFIKWLDDNKKNNIKFRNIDYSNVYIY